MRTFDGDRWHGAAVFSADERHRYLHCWTWNASRPVISAGLMNPSTATERRLDPTLRRFTKFCDDWGFGGFRLWNAYALRSTDPKVCLESSDRIGALNDDVIRTELAAAHTLVLAWGTKIEKARAYDLRKLIEQTFIGTPLCIRVSKDGHPEHPLYLPSSLEPQEWRPPR